MALEELHYSSFYSMLHGATCSTELMNMLLVVRLVADRHT